jgi:histidinol-phosphate aminotransferase
MTRLVKPQSALDDIAAYVPGRPVEEVQRELGLGEVIKLASNENPMAPAPMAVAAMQAALPRLNSYPDGECYYLRQALAAHLDVKPEQIAVGNGADGLIMQTCMAYLDQDDEVIVSRSSFPVYDVFATAMRGRLIKTSLKDYRLDLDAMRAAITPKTKLIFVCNPNNPTGTVVTAGEVEAFMRAVPEDVLVIFDEAYYEFVDSPDYPQTAKYVHAGRKNVMVMRTYSKVYGLAGIRLGYAIADPDVLTPLSKIREPFAVNLLAQAAGAAALRDTEYVQRSIALNAAGRRHLCREFDRMGLRYVESHTNFLLVRIGPEAERIAQALLAKGIIVRPCDGYDLPEFLRITVGDPAQNARLIETLDSLLETAGQ